jgi:2-desacetyl-2-hydroxyethyl bacteriochlorophyllide A dehydrogenase
MRAVVFEKPGGIEVTRLDDPTPGPSDVILKVEACGICGTDLHLLNGDISSAHYPVVPGHEFCGEVVAVGREVGNLRSGDFVAVDPNLPDDTCRFCRMGRTNLCENYSALGVTLNGAAAEFVRVPSHVAFALPADLPRRWGTLVEPLSCAVHGFDQIGIQLADRYLIYGAGTMGLMLAQLARHAGSAGVDMVDKNPARFELAKRLAADRIAESADHFDRPGGWDVVIDATGAVPAIEDGIRRVRPGGSFLVFGVASGEARATFSPFDVYRKEIRIIGSMAVLNSFERALELVVRGVINSEAMISHQFGLDDYRKAIDTFKSGGGLKIQVVPSEASRPNSSLVGAITRPLVP